MECYAGIDAGSTYVKVAMVSNNGLLGQKVAPTGIECRNTAGRMFDELRGELGVSRSDIKAIISTGYSRRLIDIADETVTEIKAHAAGASWTAPGEKGVGTIIDIGGQDSKVIIIGEDGETKNFVMNDKCAAGTGRFLEVLSRVLELNIEEFGPLSLQAKVPCHINSICAVFAESEVISLLARGKQRMDIIAGIHRSLAKRVAGMARRAGLEPEVLLTGGVALNSGLVAAIEDDLGMKIHVADNPQFNGAIGSAVIAGNLNGGEA
ncbi:MAG: benzoyl-CoA reductase [Deltaproteobacteria bacterium]|nr:benzoyl-CoA reductase [Deltaproteobacteria bacterium]